MTADSHRHADRGTIGCAILTASDTRTPEQDESGQLIRLLLENGGHAIRFYRVVPDDPAAIGTAVGEAESDPAVRVILLNGGTGIAPRDRTYEAVCDLIERPLPGFGELFRMLSFEEIGAAAMLTRATAGIRGSRALFSLPGSPGAVRLAVERLILPELGHLIGQLDLG